MIVAVIAVVLLLLFMQKPATGAPVPYSDYGALQRLAATGKFNVPIPAPIATQSAVDSLGFAVLPGTPPIPQPEDAVPGFNDTSGVTLIYPSTVTPQGGF